jgi:TolB-like protein/Flp pilus assembly protein TadD
MAFLAEIKRRRVGRVAIAYGAIAWAVTEASSVILPALYVPEWAMTFIVVFLLIGFPIAMVLAWIFDVGPEGIQRTEPIARETQSSRIKLRTAFAVAVIIAMVGLGYLLFERGLGRAHAVGMGDSIAVLPFANLSGDPSKDYFSDGMSEELLNLLARIPGLQVASRTSSFAYKGRNIDIREVGRELGVDTVLEGSVRQAGDQVRITAQLIDTSTGFHVWSETYERQLADIFQVQDEIAAAIVDKLRIDLAPEEQVASQRDKAPTQDVEAYELYLQGRAIWKRRGEENIRRSIELYQAAIGHDPAFARAYAALASAYVILPGYSKEKGDAAEIIRLAEESARKALTLDPNIGEAHAVLAQINADRGNLLDAESGFFFAIALEPNEATPHQWYSLLLAKVGRIDAALEQAIKAQDLDPSSPVVAANLANIYLLKGNDEQALRLTQLSEELGLSRVNTGIPITVAERRGEWDKVRELTRQQASTDWPEGLRPYADGFVDALKDPALRPKAVADMRLIDPNIIRQQDLIVAYVQLGALDVAFEVMQQALDADSTAWLDEWDFSTSWATESKALREDPRFAALAERIGIVEYWKQYGYPDGCRAGADTPLVCS